jgi:hypothetical protein
MSSSLVGKHVSLDDAASYGNPPLDLQLGFSGNFSHFSSGTLDTSDKRLQLVRSILSSGARHHKPDQQAIVDQLLYNALQLAVEAGFAPDKTSALGGIVLETFYLSMSEFLPLESSYALFKELLTKHCVQRPPWRCALLQSEQPQPPETLNLFHCPL